MKREPAVSAVVISRNEGRELRLTVENLDDTLPAGGDIVVIDDGSTDRSAERLRLKRGRIRVRRVRDLGVARARNLGARLSRGKIVVFCDAHIRVPERWWQPLAEILEDPRAGGAAPAVNDLAPGRATCYGLRFKGPSLEAHWLRERHSSPFPAPILPGCCFAMRRDVFEKTGGWDERMHRRGGVDNEGCVRFWLLGYDLTIAPEVVCGHLFRERSPYHVGWPGFLYNRMRLAFAHLNRERLGKAIAAQSEHDGFGEALEMIAASDVNQRRSEMMARRRRTDDWYFERFGMQW